MQDKPIFHKKSGLCSLCGQKHSKLSIDHIPPKCCGNTEAVQMAAYYGDTFVNRNDGSSFITLCRDCNTFLGENYDKVLGAFCKEIKGYIESCLHFPHSYYTIHTHPIKLAKAVVGHFLATIVDDDILRSPELQKLSSFVLDKNQNQLEGIKIFYWLYPYDTIVARNMLLKHNVYGVSSVFNDKLFHVLKFYPVAFAIVHVNDECNSDIDELTKYFVGPENRTIRISKQGLTFAPSYPERLSDAEVALRAEAATDIIAVKKG